MRLRKLVFLWTLSAAWSPVHAAQSAAGEDPQAASEKPIDEITVVAPRSENSIRAEIIAVEEKMFDIFNAVNTNRDFHVVCGWEDRDTGNPSTVSRLKEWRCVSLGEKHILSREFANVTGRDAVANARSLETLMQGPIRRHRANMQQEMIALAEENPELANAIYERAALERDLAEARRRKNE